MKPLIVKKIECHFIRELGKICLRGGPRRVQWQYKMVKDNWGNLHRSPAYKALLGMHNVHPTRPKRGG